MSQTNRELSCSKIWPEGTRIKSGDAVNAPSMALKSEESRVFLTRNGAGSDNARCYGFSPRDMETHICQTAASPQEKLLNADFRVGDGRPFSACATISETARELCRAVSVSLGLATESSDVEPPVPPSASNQQMSGASFFGMNCSGAQPAAVPDYRCPDPHGQKQAVKMFKSSDFQHLMNAQNFTLRESDDTTPDETDLQDAGRVASCPYARTATTAPNFAHFARASADRPCGAYEPPDDPAGEFGGVTEDKSAGYQPEQYSVKVKCEDAGSWWASNYTFNKKYNTQIWGSRHSTHDTGPNPAFICNPYEGGVVRPEQRYPGGVPRTPYPNPSCMKTEVGEWLDVAYNDTR